MAQKYSIIYNDVVNIEHEIQIFDDAYSGDVIDVQGRAFLDASAADDNLEAIRGLGLQVELEADQDMTYSDLYSEEEKTFPVTYIRDSVTLFEGWLNPEGWFEDYVNLKWKVSFTCVDGLGYLKDLSFVNSDGTLITGRRTQLDIISLALQRTGLQKDINVSIDIYYTGLSTSVCVLENATVVSERYVKDDDVTIMSCDEVLRDILEPYGAVLKSYADAWYIYKPNQLFSNRAQDFFNFDYLGVSGTDFSQDFSQPLGSATLGFSPHHIGENQKISVEPSTGAYRISYKYGLIESFYKNTRLISDDGTTIDDWDIISTAFLETPFPIGTGRVTFDGSTSSETEHLRTDTITLTTDVQTDVEINFTPLSPNSGWVFKYKIFISDKVLPDGTADIYYLDNRPLGTEPEWGAVGVDNLLTLSGFSYGGNIVINDITPSKPAAITGDGFLYVSIYNPSVLASGGNEFLDLNEVRVSPVQTDSNIIGEFHTFQRTTKPSAQVKQIKTVATGDNEADVYVGTIYKADTSTATVTWFRADFPSEEKPILQLMGEELMRMNQLPTRVFSGEVYGFISYLNVLTIDNQDGLWMILEYSYDTKENRIQMVSRQILGDELTDLDYEQTTDYGNTVKPTIVG